MHHDPAKHEFFAEETELWNRDLGKLRGMTWRAWSHGRDDIVCFLSPSKTQPYFLRFCFLMGLALRYHEV